MPCRSIADVLRGLGEVPPSEMALIDDGRPEPNLNVSPWIDATRIAAANACDVLERIERGSGDDRPSWERRAEAREAWALVNAAQRVKWRFTFSSKAVAKPRLKPEKSAEEKARSNAYAKEYMRALRARRKAEASTVVA
jgi:hypothetical protein